jgi:endonuclease/exonuclease/phosphatase family metal-dependent hydrolase
MRKSLNALAVVFAAVIGFVFWAKSPVALGPPLSGAGIVSYPGAESKIFAGTLRVLSYNIGYAYGDANNKRILPQDQVARNLNLAVSALEHLSPDVICLQEIDFDSDRSGRVDQLAFLAQRLGYAYAAYDVNWNKRYVPFPYWPPQNHFGRMVSGQAVLSRYPILANRVHVFAKPPNPFWYNWFYLERTAQETQLDLGDGRSVRLWNVHLEAFHRPTRLAQADTFAKIVGSSDGGFRIVAGDFNDPNVEDDAVGIPYPDNAFIRFLDATDMSEATSKRDGLTFPSWAPVERLDHIVFSKDMTASGSGTENVLASDHLPVWVDLKL